MIIMLMLTPPMITVIYKDNFGNLAAPNAIFYGEVGDGYNINLELGSGYSISSVMDTKNTIDKKDDRSFELEGKFIENQNSIIVVTFESLKVSSPITVDYVDENGFSLNPQKVVTAKVGDKFSELPPEIEGYTLVIDTSDELKFDGSEHHVVYRYVKNPEIAGVLTVSYIDDESGNSIATSHVISGNIGDEYDVSTPEFVRDIGGYTLIEMPSNAKGELEKSTKTVVFRYSRNKIPAGTVTLEHVTALDSNGIPIQSNVSVMSGYVGETFTYEAANIPGYTFIGVGNTKTRASKQTLSGVYTLEPQTIELQYSKNPVIGGNVVVSYVDGNGKKITSNETLKGMQDDKYEAKIKNIEGYTVELIPSNVTGVFTDKLQTVSIIYSKDPVLGGDIIIEYVDSYSNKIAPNEVLSGNIGDEYTAKENKISGYTLYSVPSNAVGKIKAKSQTVSFIYSKNPVLGGNITVNYVDLEGATISNSEILSGNVGDTYKVKAKTIYGYTVSKKPENIEGEFTQKTQTVDIQYKSSSKIQTDETNAPEKIITQHRIIHRTQLLKKMKQLIKIMV